MKRMKNIRLGTLVACMCVLWGCEKPNVNIVMPQEASNRVLFAGEHLKKALEDAGYSSVMLSDTACPMSGVPFTAMAFRVKLILFHCAVKVVS